MAKKSRKGGPKKGRTYEIWTLEQDLVLKKAVDAEEAENGACPKQGNPRAPDSWWEHVAARYYMATHTWRSAQKCAWRWRKLLEYEKKGISPVDAPRRRPPITAEEREARQRERLEALELASGRLSKATARRLEEAEMPLSLQKHMRAKAMSAAGRPESKSTSVPMVSQLLLVRMDALSTSLCDRMDALAQLYATLRPALPQNGAPVQGPTTVLRIPASVTQALAEMRKESEAVRSVMNVLTQRVNGASEQSRRTADEVRELRESIESLLTQQGVSAPSPYARFSPVREIEIKDLTSPPPGDNNSTTKITERE